MGYFPNAKKCQLIVKPEKEEAARDLFGKISINISTQGQKHLGAVYSAEEYVSEKVDDWVGQVVKLAEFAAIQPQAYYAANTMGTQRQFSENICSEDDLRSRIFGTFFVKFLACLPLLGFSNT